MPTYTVINGENPGPLQHPAITLVDEEGDPWDASENIASGTYIAAAGISNGTSDVSAIQALLTAARVAGNGMVRGAPGATYLLDERLVIGSGTTLDMTGCKIVLKAGNQKNMIVNYSNANPVAVGTGTVTLGSNVVTTALASQAVIGQTLELTGAGASDGTTSYGPLIGNISAVNTGAGTVTLTDLRGRPALATKAVSGTGAAVGNLPAIGVATLSNRDRDITIKGGWWERGANGPNGTLSGYGANMIAHSIWMKHADHVTIDIDRATSTAGVSFIWAADISNYRLSVRDSNVIRTTIQINGPAYDGSIPVCRGVHTDDLVSIGTNAYLNDTDTAGDVTDLTWGVIESSGQQGVVFGSAIRLLSGLGNRMDGIKGGTTTGTPEYAVLIGDATGGGHPETGGGTYGNIDLGYITARSWSTMVRIDTPSCDRIKVRGVAAVALPVQTASTTNVGILDVSLDFISATTPGQLVNLGGGTVGELILDRCGSPLQSSNSTILVYVTGGIAGTVTLRDCYATLSNSLGVGYAVEILTGTVSRIRVIGGFYSGGAGIVYDHARATPPALDIKLMGVGTVNMNRILNLSGGNATVYFGGVDCTNNTNPAVYVSTATATLDGSISLTTGSTTLLQRAASETVNTTSFRLGVDVSLLARTSGNMANNTNAALSCGTGPVICDGVSWRNLRTNELYPAGGLLLATGEETIPRLTVDFTTGQNAASGSLRGIQFIARKSEVKTQVRVRTVGAAAATPTLCRIGLYTVDVSNVHTLVASTPNDTTLFAAATTDYTKAFSASYTTIAGTRYAICILVVTAGTMPTFPGRNASSEYNTYPSITSRIDSQTDLPSSFTPNNPTASPLYAVLLP